MPKYRPRPVIVDAYRLPDPRQGPEEAAMWLTIATWCRAPVARDAMGPFIEIPHPDEQLIARPGEWLVKGQTGLSVMDDVGFRAQFEEAV